MSDGLLFALLALGSYRIWRLIAVDDVPLSFAREWLIKRWDSRARGKDAERHLRYVEGLQCPWCLGSLIAFAFVAGVAQVRSLPLPGLWALSVACVVGLLGKLDDAG